MFTLKKNPYRQIIFESFVMINHRACEQLILFYTLHFMLTTSGGR